MLGFDCEGTMAVTTQAFAPGGAPVLENTTVIPIDGTEVALNFPTPVASVTITSTQTCGTSLFKGVELFTIDNVIFTAAASGVESDCASKVITAATNKAKGKTECYSQAVAHGVPADAACLQKADDKFAKDFASATKKGGCPNATDPATVEATVDQFVSDAEQRRERKRAGSRRL